MTDFKHNPAADMLHKDRLLNTADRIFLRAATLRLISPIFPNARERDRSLDWQRQRKYTIEIELSGNFATLGECPPREIALDAVTPPPQTNWMISSTMSPDQVRLRLLHAKSGPTQSSLRTIGPTPSPSQRQKLGSSRRTSRISSTRYLDLCRSLQDLAP